MTIRNEVSEDDSIDYERSTYEFGAEDWKDPAILRTLYHEEGMSQSEIADYFDISQPTVCKWMGKFDIETELPMHKRERSISKSPREDGKVQYHVPDGNGGTFRFYRHQLVALLATNHDDGWLCEDPLDLFGKDSNFHVHHEMGSPVGLDIPENLDVMAPGEHVRAHAAGTAICHPEIVLREIFGEDVDLEVGNPKAAKMKQWNGRLETNWGSSD